MEIIRLQFLARESFSSDAIRAFTHGQWSHVDAITEDGQLLGARAAAVGAVPAGVEIRPHGYLPFSATKIVSLVVEDSIAESYWDWLLRQIGKPYDESAYAAFVLDRDWREDDKWCCSELIARAFEVSGFLKYPLITPMNRVTPADSIFLLSAFVDLRPPQ